MSILESGKTVTVTGLEFCLKQFFFLETVLKNPVHEVEWVSASEAFFVVFLSHFLGGLSSLSP